MVTGTASALGHLVAVAENLAEALDLCRAGPCAYVIVDLSMSELSMQSAISQLRALTGAGADTDRVWIARRQTAALMKPEPPAATRSCPAASSAAELPALLRRCCAMSV